ncbi:hypothetical protein KC717_01930 [Candidatus Dojkabacteria bacterium]|uniref:Uncharacterized protein n=1 Tax=Candidatus Dojkabacteria bacterium TaxID=2099670 RepID=A0A955L7S3_9BACT|nr:hypothetical protein [Candidatus Dojkabacteria bacterium]
MTKSKQEQLTELKQQIERLEKELSSDAEGANTISSNTNVPIKELYAWEAPDRITLVKSKAWYTTLATTAGVVIFIALLIENFFLIPAILAIIFLIYVMNTVPPKNIRNIITNKGVQIDSEFYLWKDIECFWVSEREGEMIINVELTDYKGRIMLLLGKGDINSILTEMIKHEDYREPKGIGSVMSRLVDGKNKKLTDFTTKK